MTYVRIWSNRMPYLVKRRVLTFCQLVSMAAVHTSDGSHFGMIPTFPKENDGLKFKTKIRKRLKHIKKEHVLILVNIFLYFLFIFISFIYLYSHFIIF